MENVKGNVKKIAKAFGVDLTEETKLIAEAIRGGDDVYCGLRELIMVQLGIETGNISDITIKSRQDLSKFGDTLFNLVHYMEEKEYDLAFGPCRIRLTSMSDGRTEALFTAGIAYNHDPLLETLKLRNNADEAEIYADFRVWKDGDSCKTDLTIRFVTVKKRQNTLSLMGC